MSAEAPLPAGMVGVVKQTAFPHLRFEWHPAAQTVYLIRLDRKPAVGNAIAAGVPNMGVATNAVLIWLRGYKEALTEHTTKGD